MLACQQFDIDRQFVGCDGLSACVLQQMENECLGFILDRANKTLDLHPAEFASDLKTAMSIDHKDAIGFVASQTTKSGTVCPYSNIECFKLAREADLHSNGLMGWRPILLATGTDREQVLRLVGAAGRLRTSRQGVCFGMPLKREVSRPCRSPLENTERPPPFLRQ